MPLEYEVVFKIFPLESCLATKSLAFLFNNCSEPHPLSNFKDF